MALLRCTDQPLSALFPLLTAALRPLPPGACLYIEAPDPDLAADRHAGEEIDVAGQSCRYRAHETWVELAEVLGCAYLTPRPAPTAPGFLVLGFRKLNPEVSWHRDALPSSDPEKYGATSGFSRIRRREEPAFLSTFLRGLRFLRLPPRPRVLSIGANQGDELALVAEVTDASSLVGLDWSPSALAAARQRHPDPRLVFVEADVRAPLPVEGRFDLILAIHVLHSPALDGQAIFRRLLAEHLAPGGGMMLGFPNGRYIDHRLRYGASSRDDAHPELSILLGVGYYRRVLQRRGFVVTLTGKQTVLLTARSGRAAHGGSGPPPPDCSPAG